MRYDTPRCDTLFSNATHESPHPAMPTNILRPYAFVCRVVDSIRLYAHVPTTAYAR